MKRTFRKVLVLGSAALKIGEAGEFDYSGSQSIKALKEEGIKTVLVNPNIATIQTSDLLADRVYFLPVTAEYVSKVIARERPDGILLSFGGQTALNTGIELSLKGVLDKYRVSVMGTPIETIKDTEDRDRFVQRLAEIGVKTARSKATSSVDEAVAFAESLRYPVIIRIAYALGGLGSGVCGDEKELRQRVSQALSYTNQVLVEEYLGGWKEIEYEVVRDSYDNCITVCNMENFDPMGIHTGESIVVAPSQTLSNREYHLLREHAIAVIRHLGVVGECNIQYALDPTSEDYRVIEVNARLSRSSALASKATGYPLAFVAAKLALGYGLHHLDNSITRSTSAFFEPALDYLVVKIPRWDLKKFSQVSRHIGSGMKSVGEVMAIGRSFEEALQKGLRMLQIGAIGLVGNRSFTFGTMDEELKHPSEERIFAIVQAIKAGYSVERISQLSRIDPWFIHKIKNVVALEEAVTTADWPLEPPLLLQAKRLGFSDHQIALARRQTDEKVTQLRHSHSIHPYIRQIDTLAAEYPAQTNYLYLTYHGDQDDIDIPIIPAGVMSGNPGIIKNTVIILGSGAYHIGSSVEFDWCCVNAAATLRELGYHTVIVNYNPETVSTDYDESDKLIFDEISIESICEIYRKLHPLGIILSMGGQVANNLAMALDKRGLAVLGTAPAQIDRAENRSTFSQLLDELSIDQPIWKQLTSIKEARRFAQEVEYPVLVRPSYVLSGAAMAVAFNEDELSMYLQRAVDISPEYPVVISKFLENAKEIDLDAVACQGELVVYAISEHVENAGVHSGDATLVLPPQRTYLETMRRIRLIATKIAKALEITGPFNIQFIAKHNEVKVIECNLRASRSFPFVSKILKQNFSAIATRAIMGKPVTRSENPLFELNHVGVKAPQFSFTRLEGADPILGVEMASTGEVGCLGNDFDEAFLLALLSVGYRFPIRTVLLSTGNIESKAELLGSVRFLQAQGITLYATRGTATFLESNGVKTQILFWPLEKESPNTIEYIKSGQIDLVVNIPKNYQKEELTNDYLIRRAAADYDVMLITNRQLLMRLVEALSRKNIDQLPIKSWGEYC